MHKWNVFDTFDDASKAAADYLASLISRAIEEQGDCHVILPGGNSPGTCLSYLSEKDLPWMNVHWYLGDERCCPIGHPDRNDRMLSHFLWSRITTTNIHPIPAELGPEEAAIAYRKLVDQIDKFDVAFLGIGEDGHTASLFPGNEALNNPDSVTPVYNSPKLPSERVSLGINTLKSAKYRIVLTGGSAKADVISRIKAGEELPINCLGDIHWFVDRDASD